ncbi:MAG: DUF2807 domain-containing protein, partial [Saprospiraceae bacterium]
EVRNDTLFIYKIDECMPRYVTDESINAVKYFVAADNLKSITIGQGGSITHPLKPYGAYDDGRPAYKKHELEKQTFRYDEITINIIDNGFINIIAEGQKMNMNFLSIKSQSRLGRRLNNTQSAISYSRSQLGIQVLYGKTNELNINKIETRFILNAQNFQANNVTLNRIKNKEQFAQGSANVNVTDNLEAYLYGKVDVNYRGRPQIIKEETGYGRVVNVN